MAGLETVLDLPDGSLRRLLAEPAPFGRRRLLVSPGTPRPAVARLRAALDGSAESALDVLAIQDEVTVTGTGWRGTTRIVVRARRAGVDRHVVLCHASTGTPPEIQAGQDTALGRVRTDPDARLTAAELLFGPLGPGETFALEYQAVAETRESYFGRWLNGAGRRLELTVRFTPEAGAKRAHRIWRSDGNSAHKDVAQLRLIGGRLAHLADFDVSPGFHGIRWTR